MVTNGEEQMNALTQSAPIRAAEPGSTSSEQFQGWAQSPEGSRRWNELGIPLSPERLCHVLSQVRVDAYGLLISPVGTVVLSAIHQGSFARLEARYRAAAAAGLCFWWEGGTLTFIEETENFFIRVRTLPSLSDRVLRGTRRSMQHLLSAWKASAKKMEAE